MLSRTVRRRIKKTLLWAEIVAIVCLGAGVGVVAGAFYQMRKTLPPEQYIGLYRPPAGTEIFSSDGVLLARLAVEYREPVELDQMPEQLQHAIVAIEDSRFYAHGGFDLKGVVRAAVRNVTGRDLTQQGGSTLTQQLARNIYLTQQKTVARKIKEILLAVQIERKWTKAQILETYLNQVYFGSGAYGVQAAAKVYFDKDVSDLTLAESAMLAGLPQRPSHLSPYSNPDQTLQRRNVVLQRMAELGKITPEEAEEAKEQPIELAHETSPQLGGFLRARHFGIHVVNQLTARYGEDKVFKGGLNVVTTLNYEMQEHAERAARSHYERSGSTFNYSEVAVVSVDPHTGYIRAMVGSVRRPFNEHQFNVATQARRQPGSAFKFFVYAAALEHGWTIHRVIPSYVQPIRDGNRWWQPRNLGAEGNFTMLTAFSRSVNGCAVNTALQVGMHEVVDMAHRFGLGGENLNPNYPSVALGISEVTPLEIASAYGAIAAGGRLAEPMAIVSVTDADGTVLEENQPRVRDLHLSPRTIDGMLRLTRAVVQGGTGWQVNRVPNAHGKTGTTNDSADAWFVGFTPELATAVWAGNTDNTPMRASTFGATVAVPIWGDFMVEAVKLNPKRELPELPRGLQGAPAPPAPEEPDPTEPQLVRLRVCLETQELATENCRAVETKEFHPSERPESFCSLHPGAPPADITGADRPPVGAIAPPLGGRPPPTGGRPSGAIPPPGGISPPPTGGVSPPTPPPTGGVSPPNPPPTGAIPPPAPPVGNIPGRGGGTGSPRRPPLL